MKDHNVLKAEARSINFSPEMEIDDYINQRQIV